MSIYIPKKINVGYQNREDTYTGKLAYVIYFDEKGKLRKEASWNSWRDEDIPNNEFENVPTQGFVLNKKVGDYSNGWDHRKSYCRVYDPRNFEFEITIENLLYILENTTSTKGKGLEGEFVYGWDGKDLILIPTESPDYKDIMFFSNIINKNQYIKAKDVKIGATYLDKDNTQYVYMGRYDRWNYCYKKNNKIFEYKYQMDEYCNKKNIEPTAIKRSSTYIGFREEYIWHPDEEGYMPFEKCHVFYYQGKNYSGELQDKFLWVKNFTRKFVACLDEKCRDDYADLFYKLEGTVEYSPIDKNKEEHVSFSMDEFKEYIDRELPIDREWKEVLVVDSDGKNIKLKRKNNGFIIVRNDDATKYGFKLNTRYRYSSNYDMIETNLENIYSAIKPCYKKIYLTNGRLLRVEGYDND